MELGRKKALMGMGVLGIAFPFGAIVGHMSTWRQTDPTEGSRRAGRATHQHEGNAILEEALASVDTKRIRTYFEFLTKEPHIAALRRDKELVQWIKEDWETSGLDLVELAEYDIYLSWPNQSNPNKIHLLDNEGKVKFSSKHKEEELREGDDHPDFVHAFLGYSPAADLEVGLEDLVFVHYGRVDDFRELDAQGVNFTGKICIAR